MAQKSKKTKKAAVKRKDKHTKERSWLARILNYTANHKMRVLLLLILLAVMAIPATIKYRDWQNASDLKNLEADFRQLVSDIEAKTGIEIEVTKGCFTTQEKFGDGTRTCGLLARGKKPIFMDIVDILEAGDKFKIEEILNDRQAISLDYGPTEACAMSLPASLYVDCSLVVRDANYELSKELYQTE